MMVVMISLTYKIRLFISFSVTVSEQSKKEVSSGADFLGVFLVSDIMCERVDEEPVINIFQPMYVVR